MKRIVLISLLLFTFTVVNSQKITDISNQLLGTIIDKKENQRHKTNYGTLNFEVETINSFNGKQKVVKIIVTISNDFQMYDSIINSGDYQSYKVGRLSTDIKFNYQEVITKQFKSPSEAKAYANTYINSPIKAYHDVKIYRHSKKERYKVGRLTYSRNKKSVRFDDDDGANVDVKIWNIAKLYKITYISTDAFGYAPRSQYISVSQSDDVYKIYYGGYSIFDLRYIEMRNEKYYYESEEGLVKVSSEIKLDDIKKGLVSEGVIIINFDYWFTEVINYSKKEK